MAEYFFGPIPFTSPKLIAAVAKASYFFTSTALLLGVGNLFWMPIVIKYGRRPVYIASFIGFFLTTIWAGLAKSFSSELAARILMGFVAGAGDCVAPVTLSDIFFLHERGTVMAWYTMSTAIGVGLGTCLDGLVLISYDWRYTYYINIALVGSAMLALIFTMPETLYLRSKMPVPSAPQNVDRVPIEKELGDVEGDAAQVEHANERNEAPIPAKHTYWQRHNFHHGSHTKESLWELFIRPVFLLVLPSVLWSSLVFAVNIGFYIAVSSNAALGFQQAYGFQAYQTGLCFLGTVIGGVLGVAAGGVLTDKVADFFTRRNGGLRDPEMRLPAITISVVVGPIALMLYGVGLGHRLPWIVPTIGLSLRQLTRSSWPRKTLADALIVNFVLVQATTISLVYSIDSYRPIGGEVVVTQLALKGQYHPFLLEFYRITPPQLPSAFSFLSTPTPGSPSSEKSKLWGA